MPTVKLIHPKYGVHKQYIGELGDCKIAVERWGQLYGKKMNECEVIWENVSQQTINSKPVIYLPTMEVYNSIKEAAEQTGVHHNTVINHCQRVLKGRFEYKYKFA